MDAIVMAGGEGTRLKSVTGDTPKPMALLAGRPVLEHILLLLRSQGINRICISLRYRPEEITGYFGNGSRLGLEIGYSIEDEPLGTAGGVKKCMDFCRGGDFFVISGDCACDFDLRRLISAHAQSEAAVTMALYPCSSPLQYGTVLTDPGGRIVSFTEKPIWRRVVSDLVNTGIYVISKRAMSLVPAGRPFDFSKELFPLLMRQGGELRGVIMDGYWCDIGTPRAYHRCNLDALDGKLRLVRAARDEQPESPGESAPPRRGVSRLVVSADRARLMRLISQTLMEAGADFTDGVRLREGRETIHIFPGEKDGSISINVSGSSPEEDKLTAKKYENLARRLEEG